MFIGGITAVILEFAEPRVRDGVWDHTDFRKNPRGRVQRTGLALMLGMYDVKCHIFICVSRFPLTAKNGICDV